MAGKAVSKIRKQGWIPAVLYGHGVSAQMLQVAQIPFEKVYRQAGESSLVDLRVDEAAPVKVLIQEVQVDPLAGQVMHIDFRQVRMDEKLEAEVALRFTDEAPAVKELGGILVRNLDHLKVRCLPGALVHEIDISLASLKSFGDKLHVRDVPAPAGLEVLHDQEEVVALVEEPRSEEELKELEATPEVGVEEVKVIAEEKKAEREKEKEEEKESA